MTNDPVFARFVEYLRSSWSPTTVSVHIGNICASAPLAMITPMLWDLPRSLNLAELVCNYMKSPIFLARVWPGLKVMFHRNISNLMWVAGATTTMALCEVAAQLPMLKKAFLDAEAAAQAKAEVKDAVETPMEEAPLEVREVGEKLIVELDSGNTAPEKE